jgi:hypothetical protein
MDEWWVAKLAAQKEWHWVEHLVWRKVVSWVDWWVAVLVK